MILSNTKITRVSEKDYLNLIQTSTTIAAIETKILCYSKQSVGEMTDREETKNVTDLVSTVENDVATELPISTEPRRTNTTETLICEDGYRTGSQRESRWLGRTFEIMCLLSGS